MERTYIQTEADRQGISHLTLATAIQDLLAHDIETPILDKYTREMIRNILNQYCNRTLPGGH